MTKALYQPPAGIIPIPAGGFCMRGTGALCKMKKL